MPTVPAFELRGSASAWSRRPDGLLEFTTAPGQSNDFLMTSATGLVDKGAVTIELGVRVLPDAGHRGFIVQYVDSVGSVAFSLSPDRIDSHFGTKPDAFQTYQVDLTDRVHKVRLVRPANSLYAHIYLDDYPTPVLVDQKLDATRHLPPSAPRIRFGTFYQPNFNGLGSKTGTHVLIDSLRWMPSADAPVPASTTPVSTMPTPTVGSSTCTALPRETRSRGCPLPQTGTITEARTSTCPQTATTPVWSEWSTTSQTCSTPLATLVDTTLQVRLLCANYPDLSFSTGPCTGGAAVLRWPLVNGATSCSASSSNSESKFVGVVPTSATRTVENGLTARRVYTLTCTSSRGQNSASVTVGP